jgi:hypothetical protein
MSYHTEAKRDGNRAADTVEKMIEAGFDLDETRTGTSLTTRSLPPPTCPEKVGAKWPVTGLAYPQRARDPPPNVVTIGL